MSIEAAKIIGSILVGSVNVFIISAALRAGFRPLCLVFMWNIVKMATSEFIT